MKDFGKRLRELRKEKGYTQAEFAARVGIAQNTLSQFENEIAMPSIPVLIAIAQTLDVSTDFLLGLSENI